jgi:hypothetical protein
MRSSEGSVAFFGRAGIPVGSVGCGLQGKWDTGVLEKGQSKTVTFSGARQLLLHLRTAPVDVRAGHRRINLKSGNTCADARDE